MEFPTPNSQLRISNSEFSPRVLHAPCDPPYGDRQGSFEIAVLAVRSPPASQQIDLEQADGVDVGIADVHRASQHRRVLEELPLLDQDVAEGRREKPPRMEDLQLELVQKRGFEHEREYIGRLRSQGRCGRRICPFAHSPETGSGLNPP